MSITVRSFVLCDEARKEVTQKDILIGVYGAGIATPLIPVVMELAFWAELQPETTGQSILKFRFQLPGGEDPVIIELVGEVLTLESSTVAVSGIAIPLTKEGELIVSYTDNGADWTEITRKRVIHSTPATPIPNA